MHYLVTDAAGGEGFCGLGGYIANEEGQVLHIFNHQIPSLQQTTILLESQAIIFGMWECINRGMDDIVVITDSASSVDSFYRPDCIKQYALNMREMASLFSSFSIMWRNRTYQMLADALAGYGRRNIPADEGVERIRTNWYALGRRLPSWDDHIVAIHYGLIHKDGRGRMKSSVKRTRSHTNT